MLSFVINAIKQHMEENCSSFVMNMNTQLPQQHNSMRTRSVYLKYFYYVSIYAF